MVMINSTTAAVSNTPKVSDASDKAIADFDTFLTLLTTQLANQDPLNPQDGTEFTAQLAQFSSLEQQINTNELLQKQLDNQPDTKQAEAISYIGNQILAPGNAFKLDTTGNIDFTYDVPEDLESATASIYDANGEKVREFSVDKTSGIHEVLWDGRDAEGNRLENGVYTVKVEGAKVNSDASTANIKLETYIYSEAQKITKLGNDYAVLTADGRTAKLDDILGAKKSKETSTDSDHSTALQMLGKQILIPGSDFKYNGSDKAFTYGLTQDVQAVTITIKDKDGTIVRQAPFDASVGSHEFTWDGNDNHGDPVGNGDYSIEIKAQATNADGGVDDEILDTLYYGTATQVESVGGVVVVYTDDGRTAYYDQVVATKQ